MTSFVANLANLPQHSPPGCMCTLSLSSALFLNLTSRLSPHELVKQFLMSPHYFYVSWVAQCSWKLTSTRILRTWPYLEVGPSQRLLRISRGNHSGFRVGPQSKDWCPYRKRGCHRQTRSLRGRRPCEDRGWDWNGTAAGRGALGTTNRSVTCRQLEVGLLASRAVGEEISIVLVICHHSPRRLVQCLSGWSFISEN